MKRYQVNLPLWLADYLEKLAPHYEMSTSEFLRFYITIGVVNVIDQLCQDFELNMRLEDAPDHKETLLSSENEQRIRWFEEFFFEAQRAIKHRKESDPLFKNDK